MYLVTKMLHIAAVVIFLGNIITGLFWHAWAARTRDPGLLAFTMAGIIRSDRLFTVPGVVAIVATGITTAIQGELPILHTGWILWTIIVFSLSGLAFGFCVAPLQRQLYSLAMGASHSKTFDYEPYRALAIRWELWGAFAVILPIAGLLMMVLKPNL